MPRDFFSFYTVRATLLFCPCLFKKKKQRGEPIQQGIRRTFLIRPEKTALYIFQASQISLSSPSRCKTDDRSCEALCSRNHRLTDSKKIAETLALRFLVFFFLFFSVPVSSHAKMRGSELRIFYVAEHLTDYFASASSSRPLQSLVSSLKERESAQ